MCRCSLTAPKLILINLISLHNLLFLSINVYIFRKLISSLSQILNNHREPKDEFMFRLMLHSEMAFENIVNFQNKIWYQVYYHEKIYDKMANQNERKPEEKKHVNIKHAILK